jgi:Putative peptidoglycan binding domain
MRIFSLARVLRNSVVMLISLAQIIGTTVGSAHQKREYTQYSIVPAYLNDDERQLEERHLRQVQIALRQRGYYSGAADGFLGYRTDIAISRFQLKHCHPVRPVVDRWLLVNLGIVKPLVD